MKVVFITDSRLPTSRAHGVLVARSCDALARVGADVTLLHQQVRGQDHEASVTDHYSLSEKVKVVGVPGLGLRWLRGPSVGPVRRMLLSGYRLGWEIAAWMRVMRSKADLFILNGSTPYLAWLLTKTKRPTLIEYHGLPRSISRRVHRSVAGARGFRGAVSVTQALGQHLTEEIGLAPDKVVALHDGVDLEPFDSVQPTGETFDILYIGSLLHNRGVGTLIRAAKGLPDTLVTIVGGTEPELSECKDDAARLGVENVRFIGQVPPSEVPGYVSRARVTVLPMSGKETHTRYHASPMKLFEYMAGGTAIVASDLPSLREVVTHGKTAHLVDPDDHAALAAGISRVLGDPEYAAALSQAARAEVSKYTWESRARAMLAAGGIEL